MVARRRRLLILVLAALTVLPGTARALYAPHSGVDRAVEAMAPSADGRSVFVGGSFGQINGTTVDKLVKLDGTTGAPDPAFHVTLRSPVKDLAVSGSKVY